MRCNECGGTYKRQHGQLNLVDNLIGVYSVRNVDYEKCEKCGDLLFPPATVHAIEKTRGKIRNDYIQQEAVGNFISTAETAKILGISRQALNKNCRIRRGFIYGTNIGGITLYHKKSVELFKRVGDGRFQFYQHKIMQYEPSQTESLMFRTSVKDNFYSKWMPGNKFTPVLNYPTLKQSFHCKENVYPENKEIVYDYAKNV